MKQLDRFGRGVLAVTGMLAMNSALPAEDVRIAGLEPSMRPADAPAIEVYPKDAAWYRYALTGVSHPYPASLRFLEDQGAWHNPFVRPGMTGPYDIRNWHGPGVGGTSQAAEKR
jgi:hypothetical protein